jgi:hypothetical protein
MPTLNRSKTLIIMMRSTGGQRPGQTVVRLSVEDYGPVAVQQHPVFRVPGHRARENLRLDVAARLREALGVCCT